MTRALSAVASVVVGLSLAAGLTVSGPAASMDARGSDGRDATSSLRPKMTSKLIPFTHRRKMQMARYSQRHYGERRFRLRTRR